MKKLLIIPMLFACYMGMCQASVIGKPIRLQKFEVAQYDFRKEMDWYDAKKACTKLGKGWRLPSLDELNVMYKNKKKIGGFANNIYWSSDEYNGVFGITCDFPLCAWLQYFDDGQLGNGQKYETYNVRAVRAF